MIIFGSLGWRGKTDNKRMTCICITVYIYYKNRNDVVILMNAPKMNGFFVKIDHSLFKVEICKKLGTLYKSIMRFW